MSNLRSSGLINTARGNSGKIELARPAEQITLYDIYEAVEPTKKIISIHKDIEQACPVGGNIEQLLTPIFRTAEDGLKKELQKITLSDLLARLMELRS